MNQINKPGQYMYVDHPADLKIEGVGSTLEESFTNVGIAMVTVLDIEGTTQLEANRSVQIAIESHKITSVLFDFLSELIGLMEIEEQPIISISDVRLKTPKSEAGNFTITATVVFGQKCIFSNPVKAPTYNEMVIEHKADGKFYTTVVVDI